MLVLGAAIAAAQTGTMLIAPPKPAAPRQPWMPEKMEVALPATPSVASPAESQRPEPEPIDELFRDELDIRPTMLGESLPTG